jgi:broad specificity phosphatase PhoE
VNAATSPANPERGGPPPGAPATGPPTRIVLVRHGEAACNVTGVIGGPRGCTGLTAVGAEQVGALAARLARTHELAGTAALYASVLPRALETAAILAPVLAPQSTGVLEVREDCGLCELHPGEVDGLTWTQFAERYTVPDWDRDPATVLAPGAESWRGFVIRAADAVRAVAERHRGALVVIATHAGVIEASLLSLLPVDTTGARRRLRPDHAGMTEWELDAGWWTLRRYNDVTAAGG